MLASWSGSMRLAGGAATAGARAAIGAAAGRGGRGRGLALQRALIGRGDRLACRVHGGDRRALRVVRGHDGRARCAHRILQLRVIQLHVARRELGRIRLRGRGWPRQDGRNRRLGVDDDLARSIRGEESVERGERRGRHGGDQQARRDAPLSTGLQKIAIFLRIGIAVGIGDKQRDGFARVVYSCRSSKCIGRHAAAVVVFVVDIRIRIMRLTVPRPLHE